MTDEELVERLRTELLEWLDKTKWVQQTCQTHELGLHRADILRNRIEALTAEGARLRHCLKNANDKHEFYEREWYLRGDRIEALTAENERLLKTAQWLGEYSSHENDCRIMTHGVWSDPIPCTCGYTDAWQALAALEKQP